MLKGPLNSLCMHDVTHDVLAFLYGSSIWVVPTCTSIGTGVPPSGCLHTHRHDPTTTHGCQEHIDTINRTDTPQLRSPLIGLVVRNGDTTKPQYFTQQLTAAGLVLHMCSTGRRSCAGDRSTDPQQSSSVPQLEGQMGTPSQWQLLQHSIPPKPYGGQDNNRHG